MGYAASRSLQDFYLEVVIIFSNEKIKILWRIPPLRSLVCVGCSLRFGYAF
jgi:hypothetical protein